jgi:predicted phage tail protein
MNVFSRIPLTAFIVTVCATLIAGATPPPVHFNKFTVKAEQGKSTLTWTVDEEESVDRYEIETSSDAKTYRLLGSVKASNATTYSFAGASARLKSYYRIRSVDIDGNSKYSNVIVTSDESSGRLCVFPNPAASQVVLQHPLLTEGNKALIFTEDGKNVLSLTLQSGTDKDLIDVQSLAPGMYWIKVNGSGGKVATTAFIKQ